MGLKIRRAFRILNCQVIARVGWVVGCIKFAGVDLCEWMGVGMAVT